MVWCHNVGYNDLNTDWERRIVEELIDHVDFSLDGDDAPHLHIKYTETIEWGAMKLEIHPKDMVHRVLCAQIEVYHIEALHDHIHYDEEFEEEDEYVFPHVPSDPSEREERLRAALDKRPDAIEEWRVSCTIMHALSPADFELRLGCMQRQENLHHLVILLDRDVDHLCRQMLNSLSKKINTLEIRGDLLMHMMHESFLPWETPLETSLNILIKFENLESFSLIHNQTSNIRTRHHLRPCDVNGLLQVLGSLPKLKNIAITGDNEFGGVCDWGDFKGWKSNALTSLDLSRVNLTDDCGNNLARFLWSKPGGPTCHVETLVLDSFCCRNISRILNHLAQNQSVTTFDFRKRSLGWEFEEKKELANLVEVNKTLKHLELSGFWDLELLPLLRSLPSNTTMQEVTIVDMGVRRVGSTFCNLLNRALSWNLGLKAFSLHIDTGYSLELFKGRFGAFFNSRPNLEIFELEGCNGRPTRLFQSLRNSNAKALALTDCQLDDSCLELLATLFDGSSKCFLHSLDLSGNDDLTADGIQTFLSAALKNKRNNEFDAELPGQAPGHSSLKVLTLRGVRASRSEQVLETAATLLRSNYVLQSLQLDDDLDDEEEEGGYCIFDPTVNQNVKIIRMFESINCNVPQRLLLEEERAKPADWIDALAAASHNLHAIHYLMSIHPGAAINALLCGSPNPVVGRKRKANAMLQ